MVIIIIMFDNIQKKIKEESGINFVTSIILFFINFQINTRITLPMSEEKEVSQRRHLTFQMGQH